MAIKTLYVSPTTTSAPNYWGLMQEGGSAPAAGNVAYGYVPSTTTLTTPYYRSRLGATGTTNVASASSVIAAASGPTKGTGATNATAGDSFTAGPWTGTFANTAWDFHWVVRPSITGATGRLRMRVWASVNADGTSARELTAGALDSNIVGPLANINTSYDCTFSWSPGALVFSNEYIFFQLEWQETTLGSGSLCNARFYASTALVTTPDLSPGLALNPVNVIIGSWSVAEQPYTIGSDDAIGGDTAGSWKPYTMPAAAPWAVDNVAVAAPVLDAAVFTQQHVLDATALAVGVPTLDQGTFAQTHVLPIATPLAVGIPTRTTPALAQTHVLAATAISVAIPTFGAGVYGRVIPATALATAIPTFGAPALGQVLAAIAYADSSPTLGQGLFGRNLIATSAVSGLPVLGQPVAAIPSITLTASNFAVAASLSFGQPATAVIVNATATPLAASALTFGAPAMGVIVGMTATAYSGSSKSFGVPAATIVVATTATSYADSVPTFGAPAIGVIVNATATPLAVSALTFGTGAYGRVIPAIGAVSGVPVFGQPAITAPIPFLAENILNVAPIVGASSMSVITNATATPLAVSAALVFGVGVYGRVIPATSAVSGVPVIAQPTLVVNAIPFFAINFVNVVPVFGQPTLGVIGNTVAVDLVASSPVLAQPTLVQKHVLALPISITTAIPTFSTAVATIVVAMTANAISVNPPTFSTPTLAAIANPLAGSINVAGPIIGTPNMVPIILLSTANLATAPPVEAAATVVQKQVLAAIAVATAVPVFGAPAFGQVHVPVVTSLVVSSPTFGVPLFVQTFPDLVLGDRVLDRGLDVLRTEADKILVLTTAPNNYSEAIALAVGENAATFGTPQVSGTGRKITNPAVVNGTVTGNGVVHRWAAVDTVNSRLLAHGDITSDDEVFPGVSWTLAPIVIVRPEA